jgi:hypothetical protein
MLKKQLGNYRKELYVIGAFASTVSAFEKAIDALNKDPQRYERI